MSAFMHARGLTTGVKRRAPPVCTCRTVAFDARMGCPMHRQAQGFKAPRRTDATPLVVEEEEGEVSEEEILMTPRAAQMEASPERHLARALEQDFEDEAEPEASEAEAEAEVVAVAADGAPKTFPDADEEAKDPENTFTLFKLPPSERIHVSNKLRMEYGFLAMGEAGPAALYALQHKHGLKTSGKTDVWAYCAAVTLWQQQPLAKLSDHIAAFLRVKLNVLGKVTGAAVHACEAEGEKEEAKKWNAAHRAVLQTGQRCSTERGAAAITKLAFECLRDETFMQRLDGRRGILSFSNGLVDLRTKELRPRTRDDFLSYALPVAYDAVAPRGDILRLVKNLYEQQAAENAFHALAGYWASGEANLKAFWQVAAPSNSGKTELFTVLCNALGKYASRGRVPIGEFTKSAFEDGLAAALAAHPPARLIVVDEVAGNMSFKDDVLNALTDGGSEQALMFNIKGKGPTPIGKHMATYCFLTNHVLRIPASATGLVSRCHGIALKRMFVDEPIHDMDRPRDYELLRRLKTPAAAAGILAWLVDGAAISYAVGKPATTCAAFDASTFDLRQRGDPYLAWLASVYTPTGDLGDRVTLDELVRDFKLAAREPAANARAYDGLKDVLDSMRDYVVEGRWAQYGNEERGYMGLRPRRIGDVEWSQARLSAIEIMHPGE